MRRFNRLKKVHIFGLWKIAFLTEFAILPSSNIFRVGFSTKQKEGITGFNPSRQSVALLAFGFSICSILYLYF
jgi:hypothetical protein